MDMDEKDKRALDDAMLLDQLALAIAAFCFLFSTWGHQYERKDTKTREAFSDLLAAVFNAASTKGNLPGRLIESYCTALATMIQYNSYRVSFHHSKSIQILQERTLRSIHIYCCRSGRQRWSESYNSPPRANFE